MITRFDHAVIAVSDLDRAIEAYRRLGFDVFPGGRHEHRGTHNALIRFGGVDYIELLGVYDPKTAVESGLNGRTLAEFVRDRKGGLVGHCYTTDDIEAEAERIREAGQEMVGPFEMRRARPDGRTITWRLLVPEDIPWRRRWPFFIQWHDPDEERLSVEGVGNHPNGAVSITGVSVVVRNLDEAVGLYSILFGSDSLGTDEVPDLGADRARFNVCGFTIDLFSPTGGGRVREALERYDEGPFDVRIEVADLEAAADFLAGVGVVPEESAQNSELYVPTESAFGAPVILAAPRR